MCRLLISVILSFVASLTQSSVIVVGSSPPPPPPPSGAQDWATRSTQSGVVAAYDFDTQSQVDDNENAQSDNQYGEWDSSFGLSAPGSYRINNYDALVGENNAAVALPFNDSFGAGERFYVQFAFRIPQWAIDYVSTDGGGAVDGQKFAIISQTPSSNVNYEIVLQNLRNVNFLLGYVRDTGGGINQWWDHAGSVSSPCTGTNYRYQPAIDVGAPSSPANCDEFANRYGPIFQYSAGSGSPEAEPAQGVYAPANGQGHPHPEAVDAGFELRGGVWTYVYVEAEVTTFGGTSGNDLIVRAAYEGDSDWTTLFNGTNVDFGSEGSPAADQFTDIWLTAFQTSRNTSSRGVNATVSRNLNSYIQYDDVIISTDPIAFPADERPTWLQNATPGRWESWSTQLTDVDPCGSPPCSYTGNTGQSSVTNTWNSAIMAPTEYVIAVAGGDQDYAGNEAYVLDLSADSPAWNRALDPSTSIQANQSYYNDGRPNPAHTYDHPVYVPAHITNGHRFLQLGRYSIYGGQVVTAVDTISWQIGSADYDAQDFFNDHGDNDPYFTETAAWDEQSELVWVTRTRSGDNMMSFDPETNTYTSYANASQQSGIFLETGEIDPTNRIMLRAGDAGIWAFDLEDPAATPVEVTASGGPTISAAPGVIYHPQSRGFIVWPNSGSTLYKLEPGQSWRNGTDWTWTTISAGSGTLTPNSAPSPDRGTYGRFAYNERYNTAVLVSSITEDVKYWVFPEGGH